MRQQGLCLRIEMPDAGRLALLLEDYGFFARDPAHFCRRIDALVELRGRETIAGWQTAALAGRFDEVFLDLMHRHYDPVYDRSIRTNFAGYGEAPAVELQDGSTATLAAAARQLASRFDAAA